MTDFDVQWRKTLRAWPREKLTLADKHTGGALAEYADYDEPHGNARPGIPRLMEDTGLSRSAVKQALERLEDEGFVVKGRRGGRSGDGRTYATTYALRLPQMSTATTTAVEKSSTVTDQMSTATPAPVNGHHRDPYLCKTSPSTPSTDRRPSGTGKSAGVEGRSASGSPATGSSSKADLPGSRTLPSSGFQPSSTGSSSQGRSAVVNGRDQGTHAPLRAKAPASSIAESPAPCPLGCGGTIPANASAAWTDGHVQTSHPDMWDAWQAEGR